jgi:hypothetical protein
MSAPKSDETVTIDEAVEQVMKVMKCSREEAEEILENAIATGELPVIEVH